MKDKYAAAFEILDKISVGWNAGNYLDAHDKKFKWQDCQPQSVGYVAKLWHNNVFNTKCLDSLLQCGVNCLRFPITWSNFLSIKNEEVSISQEALSHIKNIVSTAIEKGFIVILDMHHDDHSWLQVSGTKKEFEKTCQRYSKIWTLLAQEFKYFSSNLIFEGMNEIIDRSNPYKEDWKGKNKLHFKRLNKLTTICRNFSQQNMQRTLMIAPYGAQLHKNAISKLKLPKDKNIIVDVHFYSRQNDREFYDYHFQYIKKKLLKKKIPVFVGEIGVIKSMTSDLPLLKSCLDYVGSLGLKYALWDSGSTRKFIDRESGTPEQIFSSLFSSASKMVSPATTCPAQSASLFGFCFLYLLLL